jgi:hypothetical protein
MFSARLPAATVSFSALIQNYQVQMGHSTKIIVDRLEDRTGRNHCRFHFLLPKARGVMITDLFKSDRHLLEVDYSGSGSAPLEIAVRRIIQSVKPLKRTL